MDAHGGNRHLRDEFAQVRYGALGKSTPHSADTDINFKALAQLQGLVRDSRLAKVFHQSTDPVCFESLLFNIQDVICQVEARTLYGGTPEATQFLKEYNTLMESHAVYIPFTVRPPPGHPTFTNLLFICDSVNGVKSSEYDKKIAKFHEAVHFAQWNTSPVLHATPYNFATNKILSLTDAIVTTILTEQEAYGKQTFLTWMASVTDSGMREGAKSYGLPMREFEELLKSSKNLSETLMVAGRHAMAQVARGSGYSMFDHYCQQTINAYTGNAYLKDPTNNAEFVKLGDDVRHLGAVFGMQSLDHFGEDSYDNIVKRFSPATCAQIRMFNEKHGIEEDVLPILRQRLLEDDKQTLEEHMENESKRTVRQVLNGDHNSSNPVYSFAS